MSVNEYSLKKSLQHCVLSVTCKYYINFASTNYGLLILIVIENIHLHHVLSMFSMYSMFFVPG